ncbi:MAG TPA: 30S ribosomal protein S6 [Ignavibacteriaceae bacterium]|nr:30S ribosomal protein S6 [Ignavibacteriaceae bacterium]
MENNVYESAVIINAALDDEQIQTLISRIKETITNNGGEIREVEDWGRKRLAYVVKKSKVGYYAVFRFNAPATLITKLERFYVLDEQFLRYLTIKLDSDAVDYLEKNKSNSEENQSESSDKSDSAATVADTSGDVKEDTEK